MADAGKVTKDVLISGTVCIETRKKDLCVNLKVTAV